VTVPATPPVDVPHRTAYSVTGSRQDAEDVLQTVFLRLLRRGFPPDFGRNPEGTYIGPQSISRSTRCGHRQRQQLVDDVERLLAPVPAAESSPDD
jgi:DNA-directed RNA polymerase specialized sigma24 family protein